MNEELTPEQKKEMIVAAIDNRFERKALNQLEDENDRNYRNLQQKFYQENIRGRFDIDGNQLRVDSDGDFTLEDVEVL